MSDTNVGADDRPEEAGWFLTCAVCMMTRETANEADTVVAGTAVCADHIGYVQDEKLSRAIRMAGPRK